MTLKNLNEKTKKVLRRSVSFLLTLVMCLATVPAISPVYATDVDSWDDIAVVPEEGRGTAPTPYKVKTGEELAYVLKNNSHAILVDNIYLSDYAWFVTGKYSGTLDGNGYKIIDLHMGTAEKREPAQYAGLVSFLNGGTIKNLSIDVALYIAGSGTTCIGGIAGTSSGKIDNCTVTGIIDGSHSSSIYVGGIAGQMSKNYITNCVNRAYVVGGTTANNVRVGGIVGNISAGSTIGNCVNYGTVYLSANAKNGTNGGAAGICINKDATGGFIISNCLNFGTISINKTSTTTGTEYETVAGLTLSDEHKLYYWDGTQYVQEGTENTFADGAEMVTALYSNAATNADYSQWLLDDGGYPVPMKHNEYLAIGDNKVINAKGNEVTENTESGVLYLNGNDATIKVAEGTTLAVVDTSWKANGLSGEKTAKLTVTEGADRIESYTQYGNYKYLKMPNTDDGTYSFHPFNLAITQIGLNAADGHESVCIEVQFIANNVIRDKFLAEENYYGIKNAETADIASAEEVYGFNGKNRVKAYYDLKDSLTDETKFISTYQLQAYMVIDGVEIVSNYTAEFAPSDVWESVNAGIAAGKITPTQTQADKIALLKSENTHLADAE